jgi:hypothetical protein
MSRMTVQYGEINSSNKDNHSNHINNSKGAIYNVTKAVVRKSILMQTTKVRAANGFL